MSNASDRLRARARLALRAERALGLDWIVAPDAVSPERQPDPAPAVAAIPAKAEMPANARPQRSGPTVAPVAAPPVRSAPAPAPVLPLVGASGSLMLEAPFVAEPLARSDKIERLKSLDENEVRGCTKCTLCQQRTNTVFGEGDPDARVMFIGEGPGENEDLQGRPFVGRAGELLNKWIAAMGLTREQVYIANIVKCRPPGNREPVPDEVSTCTPYLVRQIEIIRPSVLITVGRPSSQYMLQTKDSMGKMRGQWFSYRGIPLMPTYHPAYVLRNYTYQTRAAVWDDLQKVMSAIGLPLPKRGAGMQSEK